MRSKKDWNDHWLELSKDQREYWKKYINDQRIAAVDEYKKSLKKKSNKEIYKIWGEALEYISANGYESWYKSLSPRNQSIAVLLMCQYSINRTHEQ